MIHMKKYILLALLPMFFVVVQVKAIEPRMTNVRTQFQLQKDQLTASKAAIIANRETIRQQRCAAIETKVNTRLQQMEQNRDKHYNLYQGVRKRIAALVTKFENRGCDVTKLKTDLATFDKLISDFAAAFRNFTSSMQAVREYRCTEKDGQFVTAAQTAKEKGVILREKAQAVHIYFKNTIQPELSQKAKTCQPSPKPSVKPSPSPEIKGDE